MTGAKAQSFVKIRLHPIHARGKTDRIKITDATRPAPQGRAFSCLHIKSKYQKGPSKWPLSCP
jgi:hypothetical protein